MHLATYLGLLRTSLTTLADAFREVGRGHGEEPDVQQTCLLLAGRIDRQAAALAPIVERYGEDREPEPERLHAAGLKTTRSGPVGLLRDLQDLYALASFADVTWTVVGQAAQGLRDRELLDLVENREQETARQLTWIRTRMKQSAPQALIAAR
ncbi:hypothetical protein [Amycolatopsis regifaucium]|uniref:Uncharacterized protein n=1 Tax=Amycolatopsis regifaucium TaxID=546365 RepID=A0A154M5S8_9PSEU|nr:hypothetical protein [Amycolatopsis regifaucium]KZB79790.1 hypothetical protein AVL48_15490 [Amycolatopsis regifaucium]OKA09894.1 hypothetical protein ATP06_0205920 [Amycolatopsis regifaucium]SFI70665.1 hypothetical protein SAMN04489731_112203 [Amycolatopsis regifaucium]